MLVWCTRSSKLQAAAFAGRRLPVQATAVHKSNATAEQKHDRELVPAKHAPHRVHQPALPLLAKSAVSLVLQHVAPFRSWLHGRAVHSTCRCRRKRRAHLAALGPVSGLPRILHHLGPCPAASCLPLSTGSWRPEGARPCCLGFPSKCPAHWKQTCSCGAPCWTGIAPFCVLIEQGCLWQGKRCRRDDAAPAGTGGACHVCATAHARPCVRVPLALLQLGQAPRKTSTLT